MTNKEEKTVKVFGTYMTPRDAKRAKVGGTIGAALALIIILFNGGFGGNSATSDKELKRVAEVLVLQDQFQPTNATFKKKQKVRKLNDTNWEVTGHIRSQNMYGVFLEMNYTLGVMYNADENMFYTTSIDYSY